MRIARVLLLAAAAALIAGCSDDGGPRFDAEGGREVQCLAHQPDPPGTRYTEQPNTGEVFEVLKYYTAHGRKPFCDGEQPSDADRAWAEFYVAQGADRANVAPLLGAGG